MTPPAGDQEPSSDGTVLGLVLRTLGRLEHGVERIEDRLDARDDALSRRIDTIETQRIADRKFAVTSFLTALGLGLAGLGVALTVLTIVVQHWK